MKTSRFSIRRHIGWLMTASLLLALAGCAAEPTQPGSTAGTGVAAAPPAKTDAPAAARPTIRVKAGMEAPLTDSQGVKWSADTGFEGGQTIDRPDLKVTGTPTPELYRSERYSMTSYGFAVPKGNYVVKLHFSEDYEGVTTAEERQFTYAVKDGPAATGKIVKEVKSFSPWKASGAHSKAYVDTVHVNVTAGKISITFVPQVENPQINALEIIPE